MICMERSLRSGAGAAELAPSLKGVFLGALDFRRLIPVGTLQKFSPPTIWRWSRGRFLSRSSVIIPCLLAGGKRDPGVDSRGFPYHRPCIGEDLRSVKARGRGRTSPVDNASACGAPIGLPIGPSPLQQGPRRRLSGSLRCVRVRPTPARRRHAPCEIRGPWGVGHPRPRIRRASCPPCSPHPPIKFGGGWGCAEDEDKRCSLRSRFRDLSPRNPPLGGFNPPRPLPGGAEGGPPVGPSAAHPHVVPVG
jgi:hypothetical protein